MITTTQPQSILEVLELNYNQYDNFREKCYQNYCHALAMNFFMSYQKLHSHDYMRNYFYDMWLKHVERAFLTENQDYIKVCEPALLSQLFAEYTGEILHNGKVQMYPSVLVTEIRKEALTQIAN